MASKKDSCTKSIVFIASLFLLGVSVKSFAADDERQEFNNCSAELKVAELSARTIRAQCEEVELIKALRSHADVACIHHLNVDDIARFEDLDAQSVCTNSLNAGNVAGNNICANHLNVWQDACVGALDAQSVCTNQLSSAAITSDTICTQDLHITNKLCVPDMTLDEACVRNLTANDACINNLKVGVLENCGRFRATVTFATNQTYTLGDDINWDTVLDDPNGNIGFVPNTHYVAPRSGYYTILLQLDQDDIQGANAILGAPVANLELLVNGTLFRQSFVPYLTFHNEQKATVSGLLSLKAGDIVTCRYRVLVMEDGLGFTNYVGTVNVLGTGVEENGSVFKIHLLSIDCEELPCVPCTTGESGTTGCLQECPELCAPCQPVFCAPCVPVGPQPCSCACCPSSCCIPCPTGL